MATEHNTEIQCGDVFVYRGLTGQGNPVQRLIVIDRMAVLSAVVYFDLIVEGFAPSESAIDISDAMEMIRQGIWDFVGKKGEIELPHTPPPIDDEASEWGAGPDPDPNEQVQVVTPIAPATSVGWVEGS